MTTFNSNASLIKIAIVDDHVLVRKGICTLINSLERVKVIFEADNGQELIDKLTAENEIPDICILDINMPILNGFETIKILRRQWKSVKIIILTMINEEYTVINLLRDGAMGYLLKNGNYQELGKAISSVYNGDIYIQQSLLKDTVHIDEKKYLSLSDREIQFLEYCGKGKTYTEISREWNISFRTVETIANRVGDKLNIHNRIGFALFALKVGLVMFL